MKNTLLALSAAFVLSGCPDTKVPKIPPKVPEPKAAQSLYSGHPTGQSWIAERVPHLSSWPL